MKKLLRDILSGFEHEIISGSDDIYVSGISFDSRITEKGHLFVAIKGLHTDGHEYIQQAIEKGAVAIVTEKEVNVKNAVTINTENTTKALAKIASNYYDHPSSKIKVIGITGTNGKTTTATLLFKLFLATGIKTGLISSVANYINEHSFIAK